MIEEYKSKNLDSTAYRVEFALIVAHREIFVT